MTLINEVTAEMIARGRGLDPNVAARRRLVASHVRETRERLTSSGSGNRIFDLELLKIYAQARRDSALSVFILSLICAGVASLWASSSFLILWALLVNSISLLNRQLCLHFMKISIMEVNVQKWNQRFYFIEALQACAWAGLVLILYPHPDFEVRAFALISLLMITAMSAIIAATVPFAVYAALMPMVVVTLGYIGVAQTLSQCSLVILAAMGQFYFIFMAHRLYATSLASLSFRMEKEALIGELEQAKANSDEARRRAEEANLAKSRFLATMSHELRTPLNAILGFSEVMKGELFGPHIVQAYRDYAQDIHGSGEHLLRLINEILDLSRVEAGRYELKEEVICLTSLVQDCHHLLSLRAEKRDITVVDSFDPSLPRLWVDERAVRQITLNLLTNAIKFTPQGGQIFIKVGWTPTGGQYLSIRDTGPGIPEAEIPIVMSSFGRGTLALKNAEEGTGLGLPIVKGLVELHGGTFTLRSQIREGTEVIVTFPSQRVMDALPKLDLPSSESKGRKIPPTHFRAA